MASPIRVLVVDDSAFARKVMREVLSNCDEVEVVGTARDGLDALEKIAELRPDVVTLDLAMPGLDGVGVLMALQPMQLRPAVVVVSTADEDSELGVSALAAGAFDVVKKPTALALDRLYELSGELRERVVAAGHRRTPRIAARSESFGTMRRSGTRIVVIGASTGGPQAIALLVRSLPADFPVPLALVVHMPEGYTEAFARRLDRECTLEVCEASPGLELRPGRLIVARAGMHLTFARQASGAWGAALGASPFDTPHRPAVDVLFDSAATHFGAGTLGVVLTGMGSDGLAGSRAIHRVGGRVVTESEASCVVYGMPRVVFEAGFSDAQAPIAGMATLIQECV